MAVSEQPIKDASFSCVPSAAVEKGKAAVLTAHDGIKGTVREAAASTDAAFGMFSQQSVSGVPVGVQLGEGSVVEFTAEGAVTKGNKLYATGADGDLGVAPNGAEYIGEALQTLADDETGVMLLTRGKKSGDYPQKDQTFTANSSISAVFPVAGTYLVKVFIENTTANAVTGGVNIGTTLGGVDIASAQAVGANALVLVQAICKTTAANTAMYVAAGSDWNTASLSVSVQPSFVR